MNWIRLNFMQDNCCIYLLCMHQLNSLFGVLYDFQIKIYRTHIGFRFHFHFYSSVEEGEKKTHVKSFNIL